MSAPAAAAGRIRARMLVSCPDRPGIVAAISQFLFDHGANIVQSDQHTTDPDGGMFFMRIEFDLPGTAFEAVAAGFQAVAGPLAARWSLFRADRRKRVAIFVSREPHCLYELLWQWRIGDLPADIVLVMSNHPELRSEVEAFGVPFYHVPVTRENREEQERVQLEILGDQVDLVVLARYMQILSGQFVRRYPSRIINIHHSFLPAFVGARPYEQAYERGVKLIGATAHYVTEELDAGPIIEQDVQRVNHRNGVEDLRRIGRHIERVVLARAVKWHLEDRILVHANRTVVFA